MEGSYFNEPAFFDAIGKSGSLALLIGRRALIVLGLPVMTVDYDFWLHIDDIEKFNEAVSPFGLYPTRSPAQARERGRYVLENDERVDVLVARSCTTSSGETIEFDSVWTAREHVQVAPGVELSIPTLRDLIMLKRVGARPKDIEDIRLLEELLKTISS
jgi:hypothetical protein